MSKFAETIIDSGKGGVSIVDEILNDMKTLKERINDLQKDCENKAKTIDNFINKLATLNEKIAELEKERDKYKARCEHNVVHLFRGEEDCQQYLTNPLLGAIFKIETLEKENAELKEQNRNLLESCEGATMMYKDLCKAKEIIKELLDTQSRLDPYRDIFKDRILKAEQFLKEN